MTLKVPDCLLNCPERDQGVKRACHLRQLYYTSIILTGMLTTVITGQLRLDMAEGNEIVRQHIRQ